MNLLGLHHVTAIASDWRDCSDFYGLLLGLDRVDSADGTLNFAAGSDRGSPLLSFDISPGAGRGTAGRGLVHRLQWSVSDPATLGHWRQRLEAAGIGVTAWLNGAGDPLALRFTDPDGLEHELSLPSAFVLSPPIGGERTNADLTLTGVRAYAAASVQSGDLLAGRLGFAARGEGGWQVGAARYGCDPPPPSRPIQGAGTVRHVAWSCRPGEERAWRQRVIGMGATVSRLIDCDGYRCFFFREPDGVLFGVATQQAAATTPPRFQGPQTTEIPARIAQPIGILAAA
jgi:glyoxalase family protein